MLDDDVPPVIRSSGVTRLHELCCSVAYVLVSVVVGGPGPFPGCGAAQRSVRGGVLLGAGELTEVVRYLRVEVLQDGAALVHHALHVGPAETDGTETETSDVGDTGETETSGVATTGGRSTRGSYLLYGGDWLCR